MVSFIGGVPGENHKPVASHKQTLSHNVVLSTPRHEQGSNTHNRSESSRLIQVKKSNCTLQPHKYG